MAVKLSEDGESFYALYDNGCSLFYEDTADTVKRAAEDPVGYASGFGFAGTYWDFVTEIAGEPGGLRGLIDTDIPDVDIGDILTESGFVGYRYDGALEWIKRALDLVRGLSQD